MLCFSMSLEFSMNFSFSMEIYATIFTIITITNHPYRLFQPSYSITHALSVPNTPIDISDHPIYNKTSHFQFSFSDNDDV